MASTTTSIAAVPASATRSNPLVLWHLLSLDAPSVAALWTWFLAHAAGVALPAASIAGMFAAVWILYAADRLLDARPIHTNLAQPHTQPLEARHRFHHRHRAGYRAGILVTAAILAALTPHLFPGALHLFLVEAALLVAWFLVLHATRVAAHLPKEFVVGAFFAAATFIPTIARRPELRLHLAPSALLFAALCTLNGLFIHAWEQSHETPCDHPLTRYCTARLPWLTGITALFATAVALSGRRFLSPIPAACGLAAILLLALHANRHRLERTTLRAAADLTLLTPLLFLPFTR